MPKPEMRRLTFDLRLDEHEALLRLCDYERINKAQVIRRLIRERDRALGLNPTPESPKPAI